MWMYDASSLLVVIVRVYTARIRFLVCHGILSWIGFIANLSWKRWFVFLNFFMQCMMIFTFVSMSRRSTREYRDGNDVLGRWGRPPDDEEALVPMNDNVDMVSSSHEGLTIMFTRLWPTIGPCCWDGTLGGVAWRSSWRCCGGGGDEELGGGSGLEWGMEAGVVEEEVFATIAVHQHS